jgi:hypothetical protein
VTVLSAAARRPEIADVRVALDPIAVAAAVVIVATVVVFPVLGRHHEAPDKVSWIRLSWVAAKRECADHPPIVSPPRIGSTIPVM